MKLKEKIINILPSFVKGDNRVLSVYLLGSINRGIYSSKSDIDLGIIVELGEKFSYLERVKLGNKLSYEMEREVDIGEISSKNLVYASEALFKGEIIYTRNSDRSNLIQATLIGMYFQFNEDRKEILDAYRA